MEILSSMSDGVLKLIPENPLYKCPHCLIDRLSKHISGYTLSLHNINTPVLNFQIDFGFVCGSNYAHMDTTNRLISSIDCYTSYLLIMDIYTQHLYFILYSDLLRSQTTLSLWKFNMILLK